LRIKALLACSRNQTRDYLDIAALADRLGIGEAADVCNGIDDYYDDIKNTPEKVSSQLIRQLADPRPRDSTVTTQLHRYRQLESRWHDWGNVRAVLTDLAVNMTERTPI
jgi:hypothetical protein